MSYVTYIQPSRATNRNNDVFGPGDPQEHEELKRDRPSYRDRQELLHQPAVLAPDLGAQALELRSHILSAGRVRNVVLRVLVGQPC